MLRFIGIITFLTLLSRAIRPSNSGGQAYNLQYQLAGGRKFYSGFYSSNKCFDLSNCHSSALVALESGSAPLPNGFIYAVFDGPACTGRYFFLPGETTVAGMNQIGYFGMASFALVSIGKIDRQTVESDGNLITSLVFDGAECGGFGIESYRDLCRKKDLRCLGDCCAKRSNK
ncbi:hypothetical protein BDR26DRAFT_858337 [Obelidium mucronatum]|nr:hypothetical protein BDR26DRAFT_858337 [Obelidium mucronatum]